VFGNGRLVIIFDDLDRCQPEKIHEIVEAITFLATPGECYIVLAWRVR
jgi:predicted KAP-like P-loop ATPase